MDRRQDVVIIGGGPGGYVAAIRAAQLGLKVALVEKEHLGGVCLNWGCIPTKALLRNAEVIALLTQGKTFGFTLEGFQADYGAAVRRSRKVADRLVKGVAALMRKNGVQVIEGTGRIAGPGIVEVAPNNDRRGDPPWSPLHLQADHIIVATGARARAIPGVEVDGERVITARHALALQERPGSVVVVGAGPIGMEFAHLWRAYGAAVTVVEMLPHLLPLEDEEVSTEIERAFRRRKVRALIATRVEGIDPTADGVRVRVRKDGGKEESLEAEKALIAIGVRPNSEGLGLEEAGVELDPGGVVVDERMRTTAPSIYAIGDVTGKLPLAHVASAQGIIAAEAIAGLDPEPLDYDAIPRCTYCQPQVASFGLTEAQAREQGYAVRVGRFPFLPNGKALALGENRGFAKLVADGATGRLLGAHLVGPEVTELLPELVLARTAGLSPEAVARAVHAHPTLGEVLAEAAHAVFGRPIHI
ncbi:MAG TPA: dihydrolipoyl dehydrogenase [Anaerolineales bacterium]|nr:dihydrolipoyl dehydrogenase [Anaerolineae bacterium]HIQ01997.1 dihydrolipoyl dehydrogenase [Anaerolineales bacterium]